MAKLLAETYKEYTDRLEQQLKIQKLGEGSFGKVYQHPTLPNVVVKVVNKDNANWDWWGFVKEQPKNPWVPKLYGLHDLVLDNSTAGFAVFMEKLEPMQAMGWEGVRDFFFPFDVYDRNKWRLFAQRCKDKHLAAVAHYLGNCKWLLDVSRKNVMLRGHQPVFVDPVA